MMEKGNKNKNLSNHLIYLKSYLYRIHWYVSMRPFQISFPKLEKLHAKTLLCEVHATFQLYFAKGDFSCHTTTGNEYDDKLKKMICDCILLETIAKLASSDYDKIYYSGLWNYSLNYEFGRGFIWFSLLDGV